MFLMNHIGFATLIIKKNVLTIVNLSSDLVDKSSSVSFTYKIANKCEFKDNQRLHIQA